MTGPLRIERRLDTPKWLKVAVPLASIVLAAIIVGILLRLPGHNPISTYHQMYSASVTADGALTSTFVYATPMLFTGLCAAFAFRMRTWNIGGEGQLYMGAVGASAMGLVLGDWPRPLLIIAMIIGGALAGMLWACIPALFRAYLRTNEILTSLMLNYVAGFFMYYLIYDSSSYWRDLTTPGATVFPTGKTLGRERQLAGHHHRVVHAADGIHPRGRPGRRSARAHPFHSLRIRDARDGRFATGGELLRHPHQAEDRLGDGDIRWHRRHRRLQPDRRFRARARSPRARAGAVRLHGHRRRCPRALQPARRRAGVAAHRRPHERRLCPGRPLLPDRPRGHHGGDHPLHSARRRDPGSLPDRTASPCRFPGVGAAGVGTEVVS